MLKIIRSTALGRRGIKIMYQWIGRWSLAAKIFSGIAMMAIVALTVGGIGLTLMGSMNASARSIYPDGMLPQNAIRKVSQDITTTTQHVLNHAISTDVVAWARYESLVKQDDTTFATDLAAYGAVTHTPGVTTTLNSAWQKYQKGRDQMMAASRRGDVAEVARLRDHVAGPAADEAQALAEQVIARETANAK